MSVVFFFYPFVFVVLNFVRLPDLQTMFFSLEGVFKAGMRLIKPQPTNQIMYYPPPIQRTQHLSTVQNSDPTTK